MQNAPEGVRLAVLHQADFVELDVLKKAGGGFLCAHGWARGAELGACLMEVGGKMGLVAHLKGTYEEADLLRLVEEILRHLPLERVVFAAHHSRVLWKLRQLIPKGRLARFGLWPSLMGLWKQQPWDCCMINQLLLPRWLVVALQRRGFEVVASCVWELRSTRSVRKLGVDGAFVNLYHPRQAEQGSGDTL